ncbi:hypothetical protein D1872_326840 [compost metagenome]
MYRHRSTNAQGYILFGKSKYLPKTSYIDPGFAGCLGVKLIVLLFALTKFLYFLISVYTFFNAAVSIHTSLIGLYKNGFPRIL